MSRIAMMYAEQILQGKKTIEDVPERWRRRGRGALEDHERLGL